MKRSVYQLQKRNRRTRFCALFDGPDPNASTPVRDLTTVPTQALFFMNDAFVHKRAERLAARICTAASTDAGRIDLACRLLFGRPATSADREDFAVFRRGCAPSLPASQTAEHADACWEAFCRVLLASNEFLYVD
jgi:hypothetical protein